MGYCMETIKSTVVFKNQNQDKALKTFQTWQRSTKRLGFTEKEEVLGATTLKELLEALRYDSEYLDNGDLRVTEFIGEKYGADKDIWNVFAPFCRGRIKYEGEDRAIWTFIMTDEGVIEK